jgi:hypothetical protein
VKVTEPTYRRGVPTAPSGRRYNLATFVVGVGVGLVEDGGNRFPMGPISDESVGFNRVQVVNTYESEGEKEY